MNASHIESEGAGSPADPPLATEKQRGTLTRQDIALAVFDRCEGLSRRQCKRLVDCIIAEMAGALIQGDTLKLHDFGSFVVRNRRERTGRNPRTGGSVPIQSSRSVVFKASPNMKLIVNGGAPHRKPRSTAKAGADRSGDQGASPLQFRASPSE